MGVKVTQAGVMVSRVVARQTINGREFPIRKSGVVEEGTIIPDDEVNASVIGYAKAGERGLEYVEDGPTVDADAEGGNGTGEPSGDPDKPSPEVSQGPEDPEPVEGYDALNSADAHKAYTDADDEGKAKILAYELGHKKRAWAEKAQADAQQSGDGSS